MRMNPSETSETRPDTPGDTQLPAWLVLPEELEGASAETLAARYIYLDGCKVAGETRVGRHPSDYNNPDDIEPDALVREVLDAGLVAIVQEMAAVMHALSLKPGGMTALLPPRLPPEP